MKFSREEGLTLIELLITIAVIAIVAAISIPVITNVIDSARTSSAGSMEAQVNAFIEKYAASGEVSFNGTDTFTGWVDLDADGVVDANEAIETFTVDTAQFGLSGTPMSSTPQTGDSYATFSTVEATVTVAGAATGGTQQATGNLVSFGSGDFDTVSAVFLDAAGLDRIEVWSPVATLDSAINNLVAGDTVVVTQFGTNQTWTMTVDSVSFMGQYYVIYGNINNTENLINGFDQIEMPVR
jgi:prepilin-type N-terminal cleavage/methylation domain-containing protein